MTQTGRQGSGVLFFFSRQPQEKAIFGSFSGLSEPSEVGDYKKPESRARTANMSIESLLHGAINGERMAGNG